MHTDNIPEITSFTGPLSRSKHAVELSKRMCCYSVAKAIDVCGQKLIENQEASARASDMLTEIYAMECAVVRADLMTNAGHRWAELARDMADAYVNEVWYKVQTDAIMLLSEVLDGQTLELALTDFRSFANFVPQASSKLRDQITQQVIESGAYPISQY